MLKFKKHNKFKIASLSFIASASLLFTNALCSYPAPEDLLRMPAGDEETYQRLLHGQMNNPHLSANKSKDLTRESETIRKIGLDLALIQRMKSKQRNSLIAAFEKAERASKDSSDNELTEEDIEFFKVYGELFNEEYFEKGTISSYKNYGTFPGLIEPRIETIIKELGLKAGDRVLDVGCGNGDYVKLLRLSGIDAKGIEISTYVLGKADKDTRKHLFLLDQLDLFDEFESKSFDLILLKDILEHIPEEVLPRFLSTIKKLGKKALITVPLADNEGRFLNPDDNQDLTHVVRRGRNWWLESLNSDCEDTDNINLAFKKEKADGTLCVIASLESKESIDRGADSTLFNTTGPIKIALMGTAMIRAEPIKKSDYYKSKIQKKFLEPPIGVYRLQHFLQEMFADQIEEGKLIIDVFDPSFLSATDSLPSFFSKVRSEGYHVIGFSPIRVLLGEDLFFMSRVYKEALGSGVRPLFISGGNEASINSQVLFDTMPWMDFCIYGLGEPVLQNILNEVFSSPAKQFTRKNFYNVPGLIYYKDSKLFRNPYKASHEEIKHLSNYTPLNIPYQDYWALANTSVGKIKGLRHTNVIRIFMSNYCPYNCAFCSDHAIGRAVFGRDIAPVTAAEFGTIIKTLYQKKGVEGIYFNDDDMFVDRKRARETLKEIIRMKENGEIPANMKFYGQTRVDRITEELLDLARKARFVYLGFGVESFSDESLSAPDMNKGYKAKIAFDNVKRSLEKRIPITNINLLLFHPTISRASFITTTEKTVELLHESSKHRAKLSVNSFPVIESYVGAPINELAKAKGWPLEKESITHNGKTWEYTVNYLPVDKEMRSVVENQRLLKEFQGVMKRLAEDKRWPGTTVSRSIGVNGLAMFMAAYRILGINNRESSVSIEDMEELIWKLIETFHYVEETAKILSTQNANIVFTQYNQKFIFRRGSMPLSEIPSFVTAALGEKCPRETLISFRNANYLDIEQALQGVLSGEVNSLQEAFSKYGMPAYEYPNFKKVLLIAPCGNYDGTPLKTVVPHLGLERIAHYVLRSAPDVDCRVFNPNIVGRDRLKKVIEDEFFDVVGFSFLPVTLKNDSPMIDLVAKESPNSILIAGGINIRKLPHQEIFGIIPLDVFIAGPGEATFCKILEQLPPSASGKKKSVKIKKLEEIANLYIYNENRLSATKQHPFHFVQIEESELRRDIAYTTPDLIHGVTYEVATQDTHSEILPFDMVGTRRLYLKSTDRCKANCIFCSAPKEKNESESMDTLIEAMRNVRGEYDSVHFSDNDFLVDHATVRDLCYKIIEAGLEKIPKVCKSRTDEVNPEILTLLAKSGFRIVTYGVESFDNSVLRRMRKGTTQEQNEKALNMTLMAGIKPGMDMIFFSPWETKETLLHSVEKAVEYIEKGAYLNCTTAMHTQLGDKFSSEGKKQQIRYQEIDFTSTGKTFLNPERIILSADMEDLRKRVLDRRAILEELAKKKYAATHGKYVSFSTLSLLFCKAFYEVLLDEDVEKKIEKEYKVKIDQINTLIDRTITLESQRIVILPKASSGASTSAIIHNISINSQEIPNIDSRKDAYNAWRRKVRDREMFSEAELKRKKVFYRYGKKASDRLPSGEGHYGMAAALFLKPAGALKDNINIIYDAFRGTQAYRNNKLRLYNYDSIHHSLNIYARFEDKPIAEDLQLKHMLNLQESIKGTSSFLIYFEGVNWNSNDHKFALQAYPGKQFLDIESKLRRENYDRIEFSFATIVGELTQQELDELLSLVNMYAELPIGLKAVKEVSLVHAKDEMLADSIFVKDVALQHTEAIKVIDIDRMNRIIIETGL